MSHHSHYLLIVDKPLGLIFLQSNDGLGLDKGYISFKAFLEVGIMSALVVEVLLILN